MIFPKHYKVRVNDWYVNRFSLKEIKLAELYYDTFTTCDLMGIITSETGVPIFYKQEALDIAKYLELNQNVKCEVVSYDAYIYEDEP